MSSFPSNILIPIVASGFHPKLLVDYVLVKYPNSLVQIFYGLCVDYMSQVICSMDLRLHF